MRQVCLATVAAQIGAWIPAEKIELSPVDAVFVRMGAKDHIMLGQSTFFVEISETAAALRRATSSSLVALDELGRGTATSDGSAIAAAVLEHLAHTIKCRGIFATHYHNVADAYRNDPQISIQHMACAVRESDDSSGVDDVVFLYQLSNGACPKSYGANVAKLAGLPHNVVTRAVNVSQRLYEVAKEGSSIPFIPKDYADIISLQMRAKLACEAYAKHPSSETKKEMIDTISSISLEFK
jgi:DNA mismatch repair protein MSH6